MNVAIIGLTISSSWGNGHATTYRSLIKALNRQGHMVTFYEQDVYWYAGERDLPDPPFCELIFYNDHDELRDYESHIAEADLVIVGSFVQDGTAVGDWVLKNARGIRAFYDIDTPVTLAYLEAGNCAYLQAEQIARYDLFLSLSDGPVLETLKHRYHSPCPVLFPCSVDPELYYPEEVEKVWDLGYMGTYSAYRQQNLEKLLISAAREWTEGRFVIAGSLYPETISWPFNVQRIEHVAPHKHRKFYNSQSCTLNLTRKEMVAAGHSPSVRLFEAAACGVPIITDRWSGIEDFLIPGEEVLVAETYEDVLHFLRELPETERQAIGIGGRQKILNNHTSAHRARQLENYLQDYQYLIQSS